MNIDVSLDLYKIFCTVVRLGNMSLAAKELYISQPAVSMAIRQLESRLGTPLLIRTSKGVHTTPEGSMIFDYVSQALSLIQVAEKKYLEMVNLESGDITIGASDTIISNFLVPYLERYNEKYPNINIKVTNRTSFGTIQMLKKGQVDIGFVNLPIAPDDSLEVTELMSITECLVGGSKYQHLQGGINFKSINEYPLILLEKDSNTRKFLDDCFMKLGTMLTPHVELGSSELLKEFAKINLGITFQTKEFIKDELGKTLFEIPLNINMPKRAIGLVKHKNMAVSYASRNFIELLSTQKIL